MKKELKAFLTYTILLFEVGNSSIFGSVSNTVTSSLKFATQPQVVAVDEFGNIDLDYSTDITLSLATGSGTLNGTKVATPIDGNASFSDLNYSATADKETFSLKANSGSLTEATSEDIIADVVATQLSFDTQPSPTNISSGEDTQFTSSPVIQAVDSDGVVDTDYSENITLSVTDPTDGTVDGTLNSLTLSSGDQDSDGKTVTLSSISGEATFSDLSINYTNAGSINSIALKAISGSLSEVNSTTITSDFNTAPTLIPTPDILKYSSLFKNGVDGVDGLSSPSKVTISGDGKNIYVVSKDSDSLVVFDRDTSTGALSYSELFVNNENGVSGLDRVSDVVVSPDDKSVYVVGSNDDSLVVFDRDIVTGALTYQEFFIDGVSGVDGLNGALKVVVSSDNTNVYVLGVDDSAIAVFDRDTSTGDLTYSTNITESTALSYPLSLEISQDGKSVYVSSAMNDGIGIFNRDVSTGALTYSTFIYSSSISDLSYPDEVKISPDNKSAYISSQTTNSLAVFDRDTSTGELTYSKTFIDGIDSVDGLSGVNSIEISSDSKTLYVTGGNDNALTIFDRNTSTGELNYRQTLIDGVDSVDGLNGAISSVSSSDNSYLYVIGSYENSLSVFGWTDKVSHSLSDASNGVVDTARTTINDLEENWENGTLSFQRWNSSTNSGDGNLYDIFTFLTNENLTFTGTISEGADSSGTVSSGSTQFATWSYISSNGTLTFTFDNNANNSLIQSLIRSIGYTNSTPYGDTTIHIITTDGGSKSSTADIEIYSTDIYVDLTSEDSDGDASDGFSLKEALTRSVAQNSIDTIRIKLNDSSTISLNESATIGSNDILSFSESNSTLISGSGEIVQDGDLKIDVGSNVATIEVSVNGGSSTFEKIGSGDLTLSGTNSNLSNLKVSAGTLKLDNGSAVSDSGSLYLENGTTL